MRVYAAAGFGDLRQLAEAGYPNVLLAYEPPTRDRSRVWPYTPDNLFLDSGAFASWSRGITVDVRRYADWVLSLLSWHSSVVVANLDVIAGQPGRQPTMRERWAAAEEGAANAVYLREQGIPAVEVYHRYEPLDVLDEICARSGQSTIAIGGLVGGRDTDAKIRFCDAAWSRLHELYPEDRPPVHGFGVGPDSRLGTRYRWSSLDATTWLEPRKFGRAVDGTGTPRGSGIVADPEQHMRVVLDRWRRMEVPQVASNP